MPRKSSEELFEQIRSFGLNIKRRCELLGIGRWAAYAKLKERSAEAIEREEMIKKRIDNWHTIEPCSGVRKLRQHLRNENIVAGRKLIKRLMEEMGLHAIYPKPNLSKPGKDHKSFPYLLRNKPIWLPNQVWAIDITYIPMVRGHMYLTAILDWHSRYIVGWVLSDTLETAPILGAVKAAIEQYGTPGIINTDQGSQFTSDDYIKLLATEGIRQSMDTKARWIDNVRIERWFRSLKTEYVYINEYSSPRELRAGISDYIAAYNEQRPHQSLDYDTPLKAYMSAFSSQDAEWEEMDQAMAV